MNKYGWLFCVGLIFVTSSCNKNRSTVWNDPKSASQISHDGNALWMAEGSLSGPVADDFIPLQEEDLRAQLSDDAIPQPKESPGEIGSSLPGADQFYIPMGRLAAIFRKLHFKTDDYILRGEEELSAVSAIASYLKSNTKTFVFIEGHCDQRGPEAYNLALGSRRANHIRTLLVERGVDPNQLYTISYGKERLIDKHNTEDAWKRNRRAEFKIYNKP